MTDFLNKISEGLGTGDAMGLLAAAGLKAVSLALVVLCWTLARKIFYRLARKLIYKRPFGKGISERKAKTVDQLVFSVFKYVANFLMICHILSLFGVSVAGILAVAGVGGVAIGFGAQALVKDVITGLFILLEDQFGVGDSVTINGLEGRVEAIGIRATRLRSGNNDLHIIPNGSIGAVTNRSK